MQSLPDQRTREGFGLATFPAVYARTHLARAFAERGVFAEGDAHGHEAIQIAEALEHPFSIMVACLSLAYVNSVRGEFNQATRLLERAVAPCRAWHITSHTPIAMAALGHVYAWSGRPGEGVACLRQALTAYEAAGIGFDHARSVAPLGEASLLAGHVANAHACAERAVRLARGRGERGYEAWALRLLGESASHHARLDEATAAAHYGAAMTLAAELDMRPLVAHCHLGLGRLDRRTGKRAQAQERLRTATAMYGEMGMTSWLAKLAKGEHTRLTAGP
jgi:tetratricopeptide (TPR) repeat protein